MNDRSNDKSSSEDKASFFERARSAALWGRSLAWLAPWTTSMMVLQKVLPPEKMQPVNRAFCWGMLKSAGSRWKAVVDPAVKDDESYIFAQNHVNHLDFVTMHNATPHYKQGIELETHFKYPFYGWYMKDRGTIGVPADKTNRTKIVKERMQKVVDRGESILAFPEGTRTLDGDVAPFKTGIFFIARDLGLKVVPTAVVGMYEVMKKGSYLIRPGDVTVFCDAPIDFAGLSDDEVIDQAEAVRRVISARVETHQQEIGMK